MNQPRLWHAGHGGARSESAGLQEAHAVACPEDSVDFKLSALVLDNPERGTRGLLRQNLWATFAPVYLPICVGRGELSEPETPRPQHRAPQRRFFETPFAEPGPRASPPASVETYWS